MGSHGVVFLVIALCAAGLAACLPPATFTPDAQIGPDTGSSAGAPSAHGDGAAEGAALPDEPYPGPIPAEPVPPERGPGYPGPTLTPYPKPTLTADEHGYYPAPPGMRFQALALDASPHADLLVPLQAALSDADAADIAEWVRDDQGGIDFADLLATVAPDGWADAVTTQAYLESRFGAGSRPLIQGYFEDREANPDGETPCLEVIVTGWAAGASAPNPAGDKAGGESGAPEPAADPPDHAAWRLCKAAEGDWQWLSWSSDGPSYHDAVAARARAFGVPYALVRPEMTIWTVSDVGNTKKPIGYALDIPAGWFVDPLSEGMTIASYDWSLLPLSGHVSNSGRRSVEIVPYRVQDDRSLAEIVEAAKQGADTVLREEQWTLAGDVPAVRLETESAFGIGQSLHAEINGRRVSLHGQGDRFDEIARTLRPVDTP